MGNGRVTNNEFGDRVGCDFTMASRLRNGERLPSRELLERIVAAYGLDGNEALAATRAGRSAFKEFLRIKVFEPPKLADTETEVPADDHN